MKTINEYFASLTDQLYILLSQNIVNKFFDNKYRANATRFTNVLQIYSTKQRRLTNNAFHLWRMKSTTNYNQTKQIDNNGSPAQHLGVFNFYMGNSPYTSNFYKQNLTTREAHSSKGRYYHNNNNNYVHNSINSSKQRHNSYSQTHTVDTFLQRQEQYNLSKIKRKQKLLQCNEDECNRLCTFSPNISYSTKSLGGTNSFELSKSACNRLYEDSTQRKLNYDKKVNDYIKNLKSEANCTRTSHASKTIDKNKIERLYNEYKIQKTKRQMLRNQIDSENGLTFKPHVNTSSPQYNKNVNVNLENKAKKLMQQKHQRMLIKNYYNYDFLQDI